MAFQLVVLVCIPLTSSFKMSEMILKCSQPEKNPVIKCIGGVVPKISQDLDNRRNLSYHRVPQILDSVAGEGCWKDFKCDFGIMVFHDVSSEVYYALFAKKKVTPVPIKIVSLEISKFDSITPKLVILLPGKNHKLGQCVPQVNGHNIHDQIKQMWAPGPLPGCKAIDDSDVGIFAGVFGPTPKNIKLQSQGVSADGGVLAPVSIDLSTERVNVIMETGYQVRFPDKYQAFDQDLIPKGKGGKFIVKGKTKGKGDGGGGFPEWAIAVIVLTALAIVGLAFFLRRGEKIATPRVIEETMLQERSELFG